MFGDAADVDSVSELHRYFPERADRPLGPDPQHESDRNSYLAGGYADEFGYGAYPGGPPAIAPLEGDPEDSRWWREQIGALHPGYPQCSKPLDRYRFEMPRAVLTIHPAHSEPRAPVGIGVIHVGPRTQTPANQGWLRHAVLRLGVLSFLAERLIRRRHLNDVH